MLERLRPRRSTLRSDRRPGNRAASPSRSPFLIECQGTERSLNAPRRAALDVGVEVSGSAVSVPRVESPTEGQRIAAPHCLDLANLTETAPRIVYLSCGLLLKGPTT